MGLWAWIRKPTFGARTTRFVQVTAYSLGRASAALKHKRAEFKAAGKKWDLSWTVWVWIGDFGKGVQISRKSKENPTP